MIKNITLSVDEVLINQARQKAEQEKTSLNKSSRPGERLSLEQVYQNSSTEFGLYCCSDPSRLEEPWHLAG